MIHTKKQLMTCWGVMLGCMALLAAYATALLIGFGSFVYVEPSVPFDGVVEKLPGLCRSGYFACFFGIGTAVLAVQLYMVHTNKTAFDAKKTELGLALFAAAAVAAGGYVLWEIVSHRGMQLCFRSLRPEVVYTSVWALLPYVILCAGMAASFVWLLLQKKKD